MVTTMDVTRLLENIERTCRKSSVTGFATSLPLLRYCLKIDGSREGHRVQSSQHTVTKEQGTLLSAFKMDRNEMIVSSGMSWNTYSPA